MTSKDDSDPIANTEMFRRFTDEEVEAKRSSNSRGPLLMVLLAVLVVAIVVAAILALR
jgi:type II secretory pathway component PulF